MHTAAVTLAWPAGDSAIIHHLEQLASGCAAFRNKRKETGFLARNPVSARLRGTYARRLRPMARAAPAPNSTHSQGNVTAPLKATSCSK